MNEDAMHVRHATDGDQSAVAAFLALNNAARVACLGELIDSTRRPALIAEQDGIMIGVLTYVPRGRDCELLTLHAEPPRRGTGTALVAALERIAIERGWQPLWLITTNDNLDALRFYQRRAFRLVGLHGGAVDDARRRLKPEIPETGQFGIGIHDEIELQRMLG